jgi:flavin-binding protein dodecin
MSVQVAKVIEINCSSTKGIEDAVEKGLKKAAQSIKNIKGAWMNELKVVTSPDGKVTEWRVNLKVTFIVD